MTAAAPGGTATTPAARRRGVVALAFAGFLFGSTFLVVQDATVDADVLPFLAVRFLIAAAVLWPLARRRPAAPGEIRHGVVAGACLLAGYVLQTWGLRFTTSSTSAFITYLLVVLVPVIGVARTRARPPTNVLVGVVLAVAGLVLLSGGVAGFGRGEVLTVGAALAFALHLVAVGDVAGRLDAFRFTFWQVLTVGVACLVPGAASGGAYGFGIEVWLAAAFCGVFATAVAFWCMTWGQRVVPESQAALILLLEPVSAGVLGALAGEALGVGGLVGAVLILVAVVVAELAGPRTHVLATELATPVEGPDDGDDADDPVVDPGGPGLAGSRDA